MFACCGTRLTYDTYIYVHVYILCWTSIYISFFRDSVTIDFIRCLLRSQLTTYKVVQNKMQFAPIILFMMGSIWLKLQNISLSSTTILKAQIDAFQNQYQVTVAASYVPPSSVAWKSANDHEVPLKKVDFNSPTFSLLP